MPIILKNATYIDRESLDFTACDIIVEEGSTGEIKLVPTADTSVNINKNTVIDCTGKLVTKSFAVGHHHAYSALARGMYPPQKNPENFVEILKYIWWTLDKCLDKEMTEYSALVTAMACAKAGSTFIIDHHASPNAITGSLHTVAKAFDQVGVSSLPCYEISDRDGKESASKGLEETEEYLKKNQGLVGLHASFTVGNETLKKAVSLMERFNSGIHIHVAEDMYDQDHCIKTYGKEVVNRLHKAGVLNSSKTILAHCLHIDDKERALISNSPCMVAENMESNLNNRVGCFSADRLGGNIMLGTDGMHSDMLQSARAAYFSGLVHDDLTFASVYGRLRNVHGYISRNKFAGDGENNLIVMDYDSPTEINKNNFLGHLFYGLNSRHITDVISNGKLIVKNRKILTVDEEAILKESRKLANKLWKKMQSR